MDIDYTNKDAVKNIILQSGKKRFTIFKVGFNKNSAPVYDFTPVTSTNKNAIDAFDQWADITHNSNPYEIWLFNDFEKTQQDTNMTKTKKTDLVKFTFVLNGYNHEQTPSNNLGGVNVHLPPQQYQQQEKLDLPTIIANAIAEHDKKRAQDETNQKIEALNAKFDAFMSGAHEEEEEEEEEEEQEQSNAKQIFIINKVESILERLDILPKKPSTQIAGESESETKTENKSFNKDALESINNSILRLAKKDKNIVKHLKAFADLAEKDIDMYNSAIEMLNKL
jgi:hypothetical protein